MNFQNPLSTSRHLSLLGGQLGQRTTVINITVDNRWPDRRLWLQRPSLAYSLGKINVILVRPIGLCRLLANASCERVHLCWWLPGLLVLVAARTEGAIVVLAVYAVVLLMGCHEAVRSEADVLRVFQG